MDINTILESGNHHLILSNVRQDAQFNLTVVRVNKNVIFVLSGGAPFVMPDRSLYRAAIHGYLGGQAGAAAMADAIIGKRLENVQRSVDKMENSMQNIILEEIEKLDGILIATTNLTCNMDSAFERRFLYKIEFEKPTVEVKSAIWQTMLAGLSDEDAEVLASKYDFSGGQIENIARKSVVSKIITGEDFTLNTLIGHCDTEAMHTYGSNRKRIGF